MWKKPIIFILIILAIACFLRLWQLDLVPPGLYPDEAMNANDALDSLNNKNFKVFYPENNGREGLFIWLISLSFAIFGPSIWALKIIPALIGILTVLGLYLLTKELFSQLTKTRTQKIDYRWIALLSSFFLAISFWHINFSRIGFRAILVPFILVFGFYFLLRGFRKWRFYDFIISGIIFGLGSYTYISFRVVGLLLMLFISLKLFNYIKEKKPGYNWKSYFDKMYLKGGWWKVDSFFITGVLVSLPLFIYFFRNPGDFLGRAGGVSIFNSQRPIYELGKSIIYHLGIFNFYGDANWRHNFSGSPQLLWLIGIFFLIGLILSIKDLIVSKKKKNHSLFFVNCLLISWFLIMLLPGFLSAEGIPHALRIIGVIPVVYILAGIGAYWLFGKIKGYYKTKIIYYLLISVLLLSITYASFNRYFFQWAERPETKDAFSHNYVEIGNYLNSLPDDVQKYVIVNQSGVAVPYPDGIPVPAQTLIFIERTIYNQPRATYLLPENLNQIKIEEQTVIVPLQYDEDLLLEILFLFPGGTLKEINGILIYYVQ